MYYASKMSEPMILENQFKSRITKQSPEMDKSYESKDSTQEIMINHYLSNNQRANVIEEPPFKHTKSIS
jgi:hypothetical protein